MKPMLSFQGTFSFQSSHLKNQPDCQQILSAGRYVEEAVKDSSTGLKKVPQARLECTPDKDQLVANYLLQRQIPFSYEPSPKIKKQLH